MSGIADVSTVKAEVRVPTGSTVTFDLSALSQTDNGNVSTQKTFTFQPSSSNGAEALSSGNGFTTLTITPDVEGKTFKITVDGSSKLDQTNQSLNTEKPTGTMQTYNYASNGMSTAGYPQSSTTSLPIMIITGDAGANLASILRASPQVVTRDLARSTIAQNSSYTAGMYDIGDVNGWINPQAYKTSQSVNLSPVQSYVPTVAPIVAPLMSPFPSITSPMITSPFTSTTTPSMGMFGLRGSVSGAKMASSTYSPFTQPMTTGLNLGLPMITSPYISSSPSFNQNNPLGVNFTPVNMNTGSSLSTRRADMPSGYGPWGYVPETNVRATSDNMNAGKLAQYSYQVADFTPLSQPMTVSVKTTTVKKESKVEENEKTGEKEKVETTTTTSSFTPSSASQSDKKADTKTTVTVRSPFVDKKTDKSADDDRKIDGENKEGKKSEETTTTTTTSEKPDDVADQKSTSIIMPLTRDGGVKLSYVIGISVPEQKVDAPQGSFNITYSSTTVPVQDQGKQTTSYTLDPSSVMNASVQDVSATNYSINNPTTLTPNIYDLTLVTPRNITASFNVTPGYGVGVKYMH